MLEKKREKKKLPLQNNVRDKKKPKEEMRMRERERKQQPPEIKRIHREREMGLFKFAKRQGLNEINSPLIYIYEYKL